MMNMEMLNKEFENPGAAYRGKPFWSWNGELHKEELLRQVHVMKDMGLGGFFMHSRTGLITEYLGDEWFELTNACADEAERLGMEAWLYDEDRWPSGTAGGLVTKIPEYRARFYSMRTLPGAEFQWTAGIHAAFACHLDGNNYTDCARIFENTPQSAFLGKTVLLFTIEEMQKQSFYNGYTYVDTLNRAATDEFIRLTHEKYGARCDSRLGRSIKGVFTDEPHRGPLLNGFGLQDENKLRMAPWTHKLEEEFRKRFGYDLVERLPEIFLRPGGEAVRQVKWHYVELLQQLFLENFAKPIHDWCERHGILFTGHVLHENDLTSQTAMQGSVMRFYEHMHAPGVDVLTEGDKVYWVVKQLSSAARQLGRKWLLSELYGCTGWQMNFESHKAIGDWQALFGINLRSHHLSWYTMEGEAKRDYPASILHQSAWWRDYAAVETYFARLGVVLTNGKPCCDILVINPVESLWCRISAGWADGLAPQDAAVKELEQAYRDLFFWLAGSHIDYDYGDEEMTGRLGRVARGENGEPLLLVGQAAYRAAVVPRMTTIRSSTLKLLDEFIQAGGTVIFAGEAPAWVDALPSGAAADTSRRARCVAWEREALANACKSVVRDGVEILDNATGGHAEEIFCQLRAEGADRFLVAMNTSGEKEFKEIRVRVRAKGFVSEWNCLTGEKQRIPARTAEGWVEFAASFPPHGERVFAIEQSENTRLPVRPVRNELARQKCPGPYSYSLSEPNVCVLDMARYQLDGGEWNPETEVLRIDRAARKRWGLVFRDGEMVQPWFRRKYESDSLAVKGTLAMAFDFEIETPPTGPLFLCMERPDLFKVTVNGTELNHSPEGWWVDNAFLKIPLPASFLKPGPNTIQTEISFHQGTNTEALYLAGDFGVRLHGTRKTLTRLPETLQPGDAALQGLPFYTGAITYHVVPPSKISSPRAFLSTPKFEAACIKVASAGHPPRLIAWQPYQTDITPDLAAGNTRLDVEVVLTRRNTFGPLHLTPRKQRAYGPFSFVMDGEHYSNDYVLYPSGLLAEPEIIWMEEQRNLQA